MKRIALVAIMALLTWAFAQLVCAAEPFGPAWPDPATDVSAMLPLLPEHHFVLPAQAIQSPSWPSAASARLPIQGISDYGSAKRTERWLRGGAALGAGSGLNFAVRGQAPTRLEGDRPSFTDSSATVGFARAQLEGGYTFTHAIDGFVDREEHTVPELLLRVGVLDHVELRLGWTGYTFRRQQNTFLGTVDNDQGTSDIDVGVKVGLSEQSAWMPRTAVIASMSVPLRDVPFGSTVVGGEVNYLYSWRLTDFLSVGGSTGGTWTEEAGDHYSQLHESAVINLEVGEQLGLFFEWFALFRPDFSEARPQYYLDGGLTYDLTPDFQIDWRAGWGLNEVSDEFFNGVGIVWRR